MTATNSQSDNAVFGTFVHYAGTGYQMDGDHATGSTSITLKTGTRSLSKGQTGKFATDSTIYTIVSIDAATSSDTNDITGKGIHGVAVTSITISPALAGSLGDNTAFTPIANAGQVLPPYEVTDSVVVLADADNGAAIFVGNSGVTTAHGFKLAAGASIEVKCTNASNIYIIGTADDHVYLTGS